MLIFKAFAFNEKDVYIVVVDEVVEGKSRKKSYGIDNFYSSICGQAIRSISFCGLSLVNVNTRTSYNLGVEQLVYTTADKARIKESKTKKKEREKRKKESGTALQKGRKKGQQNKQKEENLTVSYRVLKSLLSAVMICLSKFLPILKIQYLVCDAAYATQDYMDLAKSQSLFLISRLRDNPALFMSYAGLYKGFGRKNKYGERYDLKNLDNSYLKKTEEKDGCIYYTYQIQAWSKSIKKYLLI